MSRSLSIIYGSYTIGGASGPDPIDRWKLRIGYPVSDLEVDFVVSGAAGSAIEAATDAAFAALRKPNQRLRVVQNSVTVFDFDPSTFSGYDAEPEVEKIGGPGDGPKARILRFRCRVRRPADLSGKDGRREETVEHFNTLTQRQAVIFSGTWTALNSVNARAQFAAQFSSHATTVLTSIDSGKTWAQASYSAVANDNDTEVTYRVEYQEVVSGLRDASVEVESSPAGIDTVTISGVYLKEGSTSARTAYAANEDTRSLAVLVALYGSSAAFDKPRVSYSYNVEDESLTFSRVYQQIIHDQSIGATSPVNDSEIVSDTIEIEAERSGADLSPSPIGDGGGGGDAGSANSGGDTVSRSGVGGNYRTYSGAEEAQRLVNLNVTYTCYVVKTQTLLRQKWDSILRAHLLRMIAAKQGVAVIAILSEKVTLDPVRNRIVATLQVVAAQGPLVELQVVSSSENELGNVFTEVLSGTPHHYLKQAGFPRGSLAVAVRAVFLADQFDITTFFRGQRDGYELISRSEPTVRHFFQGTREGPRARFTESAYVETWLRADLVEEGALA